MTSYKKSITIFVIFILFVILIPPLLAVDFSAYTLKEEYVVNETVYVQIFIETFDEEFKGSFFINSETPGEFYSLEDYFKEINLYEFDKDSFLYTIQIGKDNPPGEYVLFFKLINEMGVEVLNKSLKFGVSGLDGIFDFNLIFSKKVFLKNEEIYLDYNSSVEDIIINAVLIYPSGKQKSIDLPISIKASQVGTYELEITASKEGYQDVSLKEQFGVIEEEAKIEQVNFSEEEKIVVYEEKFDKKVFDKNLFYQILVGVLVLIILSVIRRILIRKRK